MPKKKTDSPAAVAASPTTQLFEVPNDNLRHFGLRKSDFVEIRHVAAWDHLSENAICLIREDKAGREFLAAVQQRTEGYADGIVLLYERFFGGAMPRQKKTLTLVGRVQKYLPNTINVLAQAIDTLLHTDPQDGYRGPAEAYPFASWKLVQDFMLEGVAEIYNDLGRGTDDAQLLLDAIADKFGEYSFTYNRQMLTYWLQMKQVEKPDLEMMQVPNGDLAALGFNDGDRIYYRPVESWDEVKDHTLAVVKDRDGEDGNFLITVVKRVGVDGPSGQEFDVFDFAYGFGKSITAGANQWEPIGVVIFDGEEVRNA